MGHIVHISDLHFGTASHPKVWALLSQVNGDSPDLVAISGDLTQRARTPDFEAARTFLAGLSSPCLAVPGNHDLPLWRLLARFYDPWRRWRRFITETRTPWWLGPDFIAVGVNTARRWGSWVDWSRGRINRTQVEEVARILARARPGATRILVAHHPFRLKRATSNRGLVGRVLITCCPAETGPDCPVARHEESHLQAGQVHPDRPVRSAVVDTDSSQHGPDGRISSRKRILS